MIRILGKDRINQFIVQYLSKAKRGYIRKVGLWEIVNAILYKFKTVVQWHLLPMRSLIRKGMLKYRAIYHHFRKWTLDGFWQRAWQALLSQYRHLLDMSFANLDGTHTPAKRGGEQVAYQGRKKQKTSNTLWLCDRRGKVVSFLSPLSGNHHDIVDIERQVDQLVEQLQHSTICVDGLFFNADAAFDSQLFRKAAQAKGMIPNIPRNPRKTKPWLDDDTYFDELMYQKPFVIERSNAWMDAHRTFLLRFDTSIQSWTAWYFIFCLFQWSKSMNLQ